MEVPVSGLLVKYRLGERLIARFDYHFVSDHCHTPDGLTAPCDEQAKKSFQGVRKSTVSLANIFFEQRLDELIVDKALKGG